MFIRGHRIRNLARRLGPIRRGTNVVIGISKVARFEDALEAIGFARDLQIGDSVLPATTFGPVSKYNAEGKHDIHRDQPMETAYRVTEWHWQEWRGPYSVPRSKLVSVPYKRYPRTFIPPPSEELRVAQSVDGQTIVVSSIVDYIEENDARLLHVVNLFLELFGECQMFTEDLREIVPAPVRRLNWTVLPRGRRPWEQLREEVGPIVERAPGGNQNVIRYRLQVLNEFEPDFVAVGNAGFTGYLVFGYTAKGLFMAESIYTGNATYVFDERWEELSRRTKAQILDESLQTDRLIHLGSWEARIRSLLET